MPNIWGQIGGQAAGIGMGLLLEKHNDERQREQQERLGNIQLGLDKKMTDYQFQKQLEMWKNTNYQAQVAEMVKAGLNPALMYGISGGGGVSTGGGAASTHGANAPSGGGEVMGLMNGQQTAMNLAQMELIKAQAENVRADTENKEGVERETGWATISDIRQGIQNKVAQEALTKIETSLKWMEYSMQGDTYDERISGIKMGVQKVFNELRLLENQTEVSDRTKEDTIKIIGQQALKAALEVDYTERQIKKTDAEIEQIANNILLGWENLTVDQVKNGIDKYAAETQLTSVGGKLASDVIGFIFEGLKLRKPKGHNPVQGFTPGRKY